MKITQKHAFSILLGTTFSISPFARAHEVDAFSRLSNEEAMEVLKFLNVEDLARCARVSTRFNTLAGTQIVYDCIQQIRHAQEKLSTISHVLFPCKARNLELDELFQNHCQVLNSVSFLERYTSKLSKDQQETLSTVLDAYYAALMDVMPTKISHEIYTMIQQHSEANKATLAFKVLTVLLAPSSIRRKLRYAKENYIQNVHNKQCISNIYLVFLQLFSSKKSETQNIVEKLLGSWLNILQTEYKLRLYDAQKLTFYYLHAVGYHPLRKSLCKTFQDQLHASEHYHQIVTETLLRCSQNLTGNIRFAGEICKYYKGDDFDNLLETIAHIQHETIRSITLKGFLSNPRLQKKHYDAICILASSGFQNPRLAALVLDKLVYRKGFRGTSDLTKDIIRRHCLVKKEDIDP
jgi:hypothetical protein